MNHACVKCNRTACNNIGHYPHKDIDGLYCLACGMAINQVNGVYLVAVPINREEIITAMREHRQENNPV